MANVNPRPPGYVVPPPDPVADFAYPVPLADRELLRLTGRVALYDPAMDHLQRLVEERSPDDETRTQNQLIMDRVAGHAREILSRSMPRELLAYDVWVSIISDPERADAVNSDAFEIGADILAGRDILAARVGWLDDDEADDMRELAQHARAFVDTVRPDDGGPSYENRVRARIDDAQLDESMHSACMTALDSLVESDPGLVARVAVRSPGPLGDWVAEALMRDDYQTEQHVRSIVEVLVGPPRQPRQQNQLGNDRGRLNRLLRLLPPRLVSALANDHPPADLEGELHRLVAARADDPSAAGLDDPHLIATFARIVMIHPANEAHQFYFHPAAFVAPPGL